MGGSQLSYLDLPKIFWPASFEDSFASDAAREENHKVRGPTSPHRPSRVLFPLLHVLSPAASPPPSWQSPA